MPIPNPHADESEEAFMSRCMRALADEFPDNAQRAAVCLRQWRQKDENDDA